VYPHPVCNGVIRLCTAPQPRPQLHWWGDRIQEWESQGRPVLVYFNNDGAGNVVRNASKLKTFVENGTS